VRQWIFVMVTVAALTGSSSGEPPAPPPDPALGETFDGRPPPSDARQDALVVPKVILAVPRLVLDVIFIPTGAGIRYMQKHYVYEKTVAALTTRDGTIGVRPAFSLVSGYRATVGLGFFDHKIAGPGTALDAEAQTDLQNIVLSGLSLRPTHYARAVEYVLRMRYDRRDDYYYSGIGMQTARTHPGARYFQQSVEQLNELRFVLSNHWFARASGDFVWRRYGNGTDHSTFLTTGPPDLPIEQVYCVRLADGHCVPGVVSPVQVPGFNEGTQFLRGAVGLRVDTRDSGYRPSTGAAASLDVAYAKGLGEDHSSYFVIHGVLEGVLDLWRRSHVLVLRGYSAMLFPAGSELVPFSEFPVLATPDLFRGARWGRYRDYSTLLFTAEYRWPVWMWLDAAVFVDYGGAFGKGYGGFDLSAMVPAVGASLRLRTWTHFFLAIHGAYGFGEGFQLLVTGRMDLL
jgi:hypothetical protein